MDARTEGNAKEMEIKCKKKIKVCKRMQVEKQRK